MEVYCARGDEEREVARIKGFAEGLRGDIDGGGGVTLWVRGGESGLD